MTRAGLLGVGQDDIPSVALTRDRGIQRTLEMASRWMPEVLYKSVA